MVRFNDVKGIGCWDRFRGTGSAGRIGNGGVEAGRVEKRGEDFEVLSEVKFEGEWDRRAEEVELGNGRFVAMVRGFETRLGGGRAHCIDFRLCSIQVTLTDFDMIPFAYQFRKFSTLNGQLATLAFEAVGMKDLHGSLCWVRKRNGVWTEEWKMTADTEL